jgi:hypothetical protein
MAVMAGSVVLLCSRAFGADSSLVGEWFPLKNSDGGICGTMNFKTNGILITTFGAALHFRFQLETNGVTNTVVMPGSKSPSGPPVRMDFAITNDTLILRERKGRQPQTLTRIEGTSGQGLFGQWTGKHSSGGQQIIDFTTNLYAYFSVPFQTSEMFYSLKGTRYTVQSNDLRATFKWKVEKNVLTVTTSGGDSMKFRRKGAVLAGDKAEFPMPASSVTTNPTR